MGCDCISYNRPEPHQKTTETILETPKWARDGGAQDSICVDACIADAVKALWRAKIWTLGSCCGHNNPDLRGIIVEKGDRIAAMAILKGIDPSIKIGAWELIWTPTAPA